MFDAASCSITSCRIIADKFAAKLICSDNVQQSHSPNCRAKADASSRQKIRRRSQNTFPQFTRCFKITPAANSCRILRFSGIVNLSLVNSISFCLCRNRRNSWGAVRTDWALCSARRRCVCSTWLLGDSCFASPPGVQCAGRMRNKHRYS